MVQKPTWTEVFKISATNLIQIKAQLAPGESPLHWFLAGGKINEPAYLQWAMKSYEMALVKDEYFQIPTDLMFWDRVKGFHTWSPELLPLAEWEGVMMIACSEPPMAPEITFPHQFVLASVRHLQSLWSGYNGSAATVAVAAPAQAPEIPIVAAPPPPALEVEPSYHPKVPDLPPLQAPAAPGVALGVAPTLTPMAGAAAAPKQPAAPVAPEIPEGLNFSLAADEHAETVVGAELSSELDPQQEEILEKAEGILPEVEVTSLDLDFSALLAESTKAPTTGAATPAKASAAAAATPKNDKNLEQKAEPKISAQPVAHSALKIDLSTVVEENRARAEAKIPLPPLPSETPQKAPAPAKNAPPKFELKINKNPGSSESIAVPLAPAAQVAATTTKAPETKATTPAAVTPAAPTPAAASSAAAAPATPRVPPPNLVKPERKLPPPPVSEWQSEPEPDAASEATATDAGFNPEITVSRGLKTFASQVAEVNAKSSTSALKKVPLNTCQTYDDLGAQVLLKINETFEHGMILLFQNGELLPWKWTDLLHSVRAQKPTPVPLQEASLFRIVFRTCLPYHGHIVLNAINSAFLNDFNRGKTPAHITVTPILIDRQVAGMLLGMTDQEVDFKMSLQQMELLTFEVSRELKRLRESKAA
jgi:hypothetical protein